MEPIIPAPENAPLVRYGFAAVFIAACLYNLVLGMRVAGIFLLGMALYEGLSGRVPLTGWRNNTTGYVKGTFAMALVVGTIFVAVLLIFAPDLVIRFLAEADGQPAPR